MAQKSNIILESFDGTNIIWERIFGTEFDRAPKHFVSVFRECSNSELTQAAQSGLHAHMADVRLPIFRTEMELLDRFRPPHLLESGVGRSAALFATPQRHSRIFSSFSDKFVVEMKVDPQDCYVGDMDFINRVTAYIHSHPIRTYENFKHAFEKYWSEVIGLADFKKHFKKVKVGDVDEWQRKAAASNNLPEFIVAPEVLIMTPVVDKKYIKILEREMEHVCEADSVYDEDEGEVLTMHSPS